MQETSSFVGFFSFYEQWKLRAQLSWAWKKFYNLGSGQFEKDVSGFSLSLHGFNPCPAVSELSFSKTL